MNRGINADNHILILIILFSVSACGAETSSYNIGSFHLGSSGGNGSSSSYNIRSTTTYQQGGNRNTSSDDFLANSGWFNVSYDIFQDSSPPLVNLESPENGTDWTSGNNVIFSYNVSEENSVRNCSLILNYDTVTSTSTTIVKDTTGQTFTSTLDNGIYIWNVNCTDGSNNAGTSETRSLTVNHVTSPGGNGGGGGSHHTPNPLPIPPSTPEIPVTPTTLPVIPPQGGMSGSHGKNHSYFRNNVVRCWNSVVDGDARVLDSMGYLLDLVPCPKEKPVKPENVKRSVWCNGIRIDVDELASLTIGFVKGRAQYNMNLGRKVEGIARCPWCYDGRRDYDEERVDCGGAGCEPCIAFNKPIPPPDDVRCDNGKKLDCLGNCRNTPNTLFLLILLCAFVANVILLRFWVVRSSLTKDVRLMFVLSLIFLAAGIIYLITGYVRSSAWACEQFTTTILITIAGGIYFVVFWGDKAIKLVKIQYVIRVWPDADVKAYKDMLEVERMVRKAEEYLGKDVYASEIEYTAIEPLYNNLPPSQKKKVLKKVTRLFEKLQKAKAGRKCMRK